MKTLLIVLSLMAAMTSNEAHADAGTFSANYVVPVTLSPLLPFAATTALSSALSTMADERQAKQIMAEGQEYLQTGEMGILIAQKVEQLQEEQEMSDDEAVDTLLNAAAEFFK